MKIISLRIEIRPSYFTGVYRVSLKIQLVSLEHTKYNLRTIDFFYNVIIKLMAIT